MLEAELADQIVLLLLFSAASYELRVRQPSRDTPKKKAAHNTHADLLLQYGVTGARCHTPSTNSTRYSLQQKLHLALSPALICRCFFCELDCCSARIRQLLCKEIKALSHPILSYIEEVDVLNGLRHSVSEVAAIKKQKHDYWFVTPFTV